MDKIHMATTIKYVLLKVTTCLYLSPSTRARSLSTLNAVNVNKETTHRSIPEIKFVKFT